MKLESQNLWIVMFASLAFVACGDNSDTDADGDGDGDIDLCLGVDCGVNGQCQVDTSTGAYCECDEGYTASGLNCVPTSECTDNDGDGYGPGCILGPDCDDGDEDLWAGCPTSPFSTGWPLEILSWDLTVAHPEVLYEWRLAVKGGSYPYTFSLEQGPSGMTVDGKMGTIRWAPPATHSTGNLVEILITDTVGDTLTHSYSIDVTTTGFFFVAPGGKDENAGTIDLPWQTIGKAQSSAGDGIVYVRAGDYDATGLNMRAGDAHKWIAYPVEAVTLDVGGGIIGLNRDESVVVGFEIQNGGTKMFWVSGRPVGVIWRNNVMHGVASTGTDNPAFAFFEDGDYRPVDGSVQYDRIVFQENTFYDLTNPNDHGASITCYNVRNLLFEDNEAYQIDGRGVSDKDDGYLNTIRNNVLHDLSTGVGLLNQNTQAQIEVSHNLIYDVSKGIVVGAQPGYIRDIFVHHNVIVGSSIFFGTITDCAECDNFNVSRNIISNGSGLVYSTVPVSDDSGGYRYPSWVTETGLARIDENLIWTTGEFVAGYSWGLTNLTLDAWRAYGFDEESLLADPELDANHQLPADSPYLGTYGRE